LPKSQHELGAAPLGPAQSEERLEVRALLPAVDVLGTSNMQRLVEVSGVLGVEVPIAADVRSAMKQLVAQAK